MAMKASQYYGGSRREADDAQECVRLREKALRNGFRVERRKPGVVTIVINPDAPQTDEEFIKMYPEPGHPGISVYACTILVNHDGETYALGETSAWVWSQVKHRSARVLEVLYAGDDRNYARRLAAEYNKCA